MNKDKLKGKVVKKYYTSVFNARVVIEFTDGTGLLLNGGIDSMMFNDTWPTVRGSLLNHDEVKDMLKRMSD